MEKKKTVGRKKQWEYIKLSRNKKKHRQRKKNSNVLRQSWRNPPIKRTSIKSFCLKKLSKSMKDAFGVVQTIVVTSFGVFRYKKSFKR